MQEGLWQLYSKPFKKNYNKVRNILSKSKGDHEVNNWKCSRIFKCNIKQFRSCTENNKCLREATF